MSDLISRRALISKLEKTGAFRGITNAEGKNVFEIIKEQPIAFDVDKVIAKLDELSDEARCIDYDFYLGVSTGLNDAIDILKRGGIDECTT